MADFVIMLIYSIIHIYIILRHNFRFQIFVYGAPNITQSGCMCILFYLQFIIRVPVCLCVCVPQAPSPVNPSALDRTAAWLMNVPYIEQESETELGRDEHTQAEKVTNPPTYTPPHKQ